MNATEILLDASIKALLVFAIAGLVNLVLLRHSSAARRHLVWSAAAAGALLMPLLSLALPGWQVLPVWASLTEHRPTEVAVVSVTPPLTTREVEPRTSPPRPAVDPLPTSEPVGAATGFVEPVSERAAETAWPWRRWALLAWAIGVMVVLVPILLGLWSLRRLERGARRLERGRLVEDTAVLAKELGLAQAPRLLKSRERPMPMHWGILRSRLLLPAGASEWPRDRLRLVLLHELAHARRRDCLTQRLIELACALYWFNPLAWLARARMREEREVACDDLVLRSGLAASDYAEELLRVATGHPTPLFAGRAAIAMARPSTLERRLRAILDVRRDRRVAGRVMLAVAAVACALVLPPLAMVRAGEVESVPTVEALEPTPAGDVLRLEAIVSHPGRRTPGACSITFWVGRESDGRGLLPWSENPPSSWRDTATGRLWEPLQHLAATDRGSIEVPEPGVYRITVHAGHGEPTQFGDSGPIELDGSSLATVVPIVLDEGPRHVFELTRVPSNQPRTVNQARRASARGPFENAEIFVVRADGLPLASWRRGWSIQPQSTIHVLNQLAPGDYTVYARARAHRAGLPDYELEGGPRAVRITANGGEWTKLPLLPVELDEKEIAARWPWSVSGSVVDSRGNPLEGVEISVNSGVGTLRPTGQGWTDLEGHYSVRFGPGMHTLDEGTGEWFAALQAATVSPSKTGWYERDLHRGGDLVMASARPETDNTWGADPDSVVLPDRPGRVDFVMQRGATIVGQLQDERGAPLSGTSLSLGSSKLWPSSSVLHAVETDGLGEFTFDPVPLGQEIWFEQGRRKSAVFGLTEPEKIRVRVKLTADGGLDAALVPADLGSDSRQPPRPAESSSAGSGWFQVIDDETGDPLEHFTLQMGRPDRGGQVVWDGRISRPEGLSEGRFIVADQEVIGGILRVRVLAEGYAEEVVISKAPVGSPAEQFLVRMKRHYPMNGRVIDHAGRPVAGARVFFAPEGSIDIEDGAIRGFDGEPRLTDDDGRFELTGGGNPEGDSIVVLAPHLHAVLFPLKLEGFVANTQLVLPEPATLVLRYDIPGDLDEAEIRAQLATWDMPEWTGKIECTHRVSVEQGGEVVISNLMPGTYDLSRDKGLRTSADLGHTAMCDRQRVVLGPGERQIVEFVRKRGARATGRVLDLGQHPDHSAVVYIREADATGDPLGDDWKLTTFDGQLCDAEHRFQTALLEPGEYLAVAHVYAPLTEEQRHRTGWIVPHLIGTRRFIVPPEGSPEPIEIELVKFTPK